jgi:hypothetical protein
MSSDACSTAADFTAIPGSTVAPSVPSIDQLVQPLLEALADGATRELPELVEIVADSVGLDETARESRTASGRTIVENRLGWARTRLVRAGLVEQPAPSAAVITDSGRTILKDADVPIDHSYLRRTCPGYANWLADMGGELPSDERTGEVGGAIWMVRAGRGGEYAPVFVEREAAIVGWGATGDVSGLSREQVVERVKSHYSYGQRSQLSQAANTLFRLANTMELGDLVVTPEPATRTILFGRVDGPYEYLAQPIGGDHQHARSVSWFARVPRDELSYGAKNSLGSLLTLTRPSYEAELLRTAAAHERDERPAPLVQSTSKRQVRDAVERFEVPDGADVPVGAEIKDFSTVPRRLMSLLDQLDNGQLAIPDFQRTFVWAPDATRELIVSMIRSFPAGALLFLEGGSSTFKARPAEQAPDLEVKPSYLVLDGQQRLTSLYQALFGVGHSRFFLDVGALISGAEVNDAVRVFTAERAGALESIEAQAGALMMPMSAVRESRAGDWREEVVDLRRDEDPSRVRNLLRKVEHAYIQPLTQYSFPVTILPESTELEAVCTIFETLNRTGKPLTPFELISARAFAGGHSLHDFWTAARERWPVLVDFALEPYYLLQVIALRLGAACKRSTVLSLAAEDIAEHWEDAVADMAAVLQMLRDECGVLTSKWMPYRTMLIPLAAAWREMADAAGPSQGAMRTKLKRWFWCACFTGEYESSSASLAERDAPVLREWLKGGDEPSVVAGFAWDPDRWREVTVRQQGAYRATIALTLTRQPKDFHTSGPLTREVLESGNVDDHHVFPRAYLKETGRVPALDSVLNHCLIDRATNTRIAMKAPAVYLQEIRAELGDGLDRVLASQQLPSGPDSPLTVDDFEGFLVWRMDRLAALLAEESGWPGGDAAD